MRRREEGVSTTQKFTTLSQLIEHLEVYQPRCIQPGDDKEAELHYSGQVTLAQKIIRMCSPEE